MHRFSSNAPHPEHALLLKELMKEYMDELLQQLHSWRHISSAMKGEEMALENARKLYRIVHTIKGSAPILGLRRVGEIAGDIVKWWEWSLGEMPAEVLHKRFQSSMEACLPLFRQLELEVDCCLQEQGLDEHLEKLEADPAAQQSGRLLVIEDDGVLQTYLIRRLQLDGYMVDGASNVDDAKRMLRSHEYQLITLDLMMYPRSGYEIFEHLKNDPTLKWVPMIVLSGRDDVNDKIRCFQLGADDFLTKPFQYEELLARIKRLMRRTMDFEFMAFRDPLTGLYNRRFFYQHIEVELNRVMRYPSPISLALIDIDKFKEVNDTYGHHVGDLVLQGIGVFLQERLRKTDMVARLGGEEFVLLMPNTTEAEATHLLTSLLSGIQQKPIARYEGQEHFITFSAGITEWYPGLSVLDWTRHADYAMYKAKRNGRNRVAKSTANKGDYGHRASLSSSHQHEYKRVLIADDSKAIRVILMDKFKHWPLRFIEAEDGEEAYRILAGEPVDLCILDSIMPRLDGIGVLQRLQQEGTRSPNTRIIMLSGQEREEESRKGLELEADVYMVKPFSMLEMEMKVSELLGLA